MKTLRKIPAALFLLLSQKLTAKDKIDSLLGQLPQTRDSARVTLLIRISEYYQNRETDKALSYCSDAIALSEKLGSKFLIASSHYRLGGILTGKGNYTESLGEMLRSYGLFEEVKYYRGMANSANAVGNIYLARNDTASMLKYYKLALKNAELSGDRDVLAVVKVGLGNVYTSQDKQDTAIKYFTEAAEIFREIPGRQVQYVICVVNTGSSYIDKGEYRKADSIYSSVLSIAENGGNKYVLALTYAQCGIAKDRLNEHQEALGFYYKALAIATDIKASDNISEISRYISDSYYASGKPDSAYKYLKISSELHDSIFNGQTAAKTAEIEAKYENAKKDKELLEKDLMIRQQETQRIAFIIGLGLLLIIAAVAVRSYFRKKKDALEITKQKSIIEQKNKDITDSIKYAQHLQTAILPPDDMVYEHLKDSFILYKPKDIVSGDFYWLFPQGHNVYYAAVDCTGHGVPGAFMSIVGHNALNYILTSRVQLKPAEVLDLLNKEVRELFSNKYSGSLVNDGMDISVCLLNRKEMKLQFAGANNSLYLVRNGALTETKAMKQSIGGMYSVSQKPFVNHEIAVQKGDYIYIFSDGYADQFGGPNGKKFKYSRLKETLLSAVHEPLYRQKQILSKTFEDWKGNLEQIDDVLLIGVKI